MGLRLAALLAIPAVLWPLAGLAVSSRVPLCLFNLVMGVPCPGCGMTRSMVRLADGDVVGAFRMHPAGPVLVALWLGVVAGTAVGLVRGGDPVARFAERRGVWIVVPLLVLIVGSWVLRAFLVPSWSPDAVR